ncbi:diphthine--ammonia ligase [Homalodisca vitripennis]|nr:diphthine--ammonia ligase [Homalodisca vitripennis]
MNDYAAINAAYVSVLSHVNPPVRVCVEAPLRADSPVVLEAIAYKQQTEGDCRRHTMHVQGISHWAPANIGPYSQAIRVGDVIYIAGQIALIPGSMQLVEGGIRRHCRLVLRHVDRLIRAMDSNTQIRDVVQGVCYVTNAAYVAEARREWERRTNNAITDYVVVPALPRGALLEWQVWAHRGNSRFEYEETGCVVGDCRVSLRRRWNYENSVAAVVCNVASGSSASNPSLSQTRPREEPLTEAELKAVLEYTLVRLYRGDPQPTSRVCALRALRRVGYGPTSGAIHSALAQLSDYQVVPTILPVCQLNHPNIFLSLWALRHQ